VGKFNGMSLSFLSFLFFYLFFHKKEEVRPASHLFPVNMRNAMKFNIQSLINIDITNWWTNKLIDDVAYIYIYI